MRVASSGTPLDRHKYRRAIQLISSASFNIREVRPDDVPALARLHVATFIETHGGVNPPTYELRQSQWRQAFAVIDGSWFCFVIEAPDGELVGFAKGT